jgi:hypothetical protein
VCWRYCMTGPERSTLVLYTIVRIERNVHAYQTCLGQMKMLPRALMQNRIRTVHWDIRKQTASMSLRGP